LSCGAIPGFGERGLGVGAESHPVVFGAHGIAVEEGLGASWPDAQVESRAVRSGLSWVLPLGLALLISVSVSWDVSLPRGVRTVFVSAAICAFPFNAWVVRASVGVAARPSPAFLIRYRFPYYGSITD
jgi:hypothetical protein